MIQRILRVVFALCLAASFLLPGSLQGRSNDALAMGAAISEGWALAEPMSTPRSYHYAVTLKDGRVLVTGGYNGLYYATCEIYDPETGTWSATGSMTTGRRVHAGTLLNDGRVFVSGGRVWVEEEDRYHYLSTAEIYDPATETWTGIGDMSDRRQYHTATTLKDGRVLVAGGYYVEKVGDKDTYPHLKSADLYDPATGTWTPTAPMSTARASHSATLLPDGRVLVVGGSNGAAQQKSAELFDPATGTWSNAGVMTDARQSHTATLLLDGQVLIAGGWYTSGSVRFDRASAELFDPETKTWSATGNLGEARSDHRAVRLLDGKVLATGGSSLNSAELYDPSTGNWANTSPMNDSREWHQANLLQDGNVLVTGGYYEAGTTPTYLKTAEIYTPSGTANHLPVANPDEYQTMVDTPLDVDAENGLLSNDTDLEGSPLKADLYSPPEHGDLALNPDGSFQYIPDSGYAGEDEFSYRACDDAAPPGCDVASVRITVNAVPVNKLPKANADSYTTMKDEALQVSAANGVLSNDSDPDGGPLSAALVSGTSHGTVTLQADGSFVYTPQAGTTGKDSFTYKACDTWDPPGCAQAVVTITVMADLQSLWLPMVTR